MNDTLISPLCKHAPSTQPRTLPSPLHLDRFRRVAPREALIDAKRFPLAFTNGNPTLETLYSKLIFSKPMARENIIVQAPTWMKHDCEHTLSESFKALPTNAIVHLRSP